MNATTEPPTGAGPQGWNYELLEMIRQEGMCTVYKARQIGQNRLVALKMLSSGSPARQCAVNPFGAEAAASLDHPNIVQVFEVGEFQGQPFCSRQWIEGKDLQQRLADFCVPGPDSKAGADRRLVRQRQMKIAALVAKVARAVHFAHQHGILHRDLKPANILLDQEGEPHIVNFLPAPMQREKDDLDDDSGLCITGTLAYMSPEQASGKVMQLTGATDTYSLGAILYHLLCWRPHISLRTRELAEILREIKEAEPERPRIVNPRINKDLELVCLMCLQKNPQWRYLSAEALAEDLELWLRDYSGRVKWLGAPSWLTRSWRRVRRTIRRTLAKADFFSRHAVKLAPQDAEVIKIRAEIEERIKNLRRP